MNNNFFNYFDHGLKKELEFFLPKNLKSKKIKFLNNFRFQWDLRFYLEANLEEEE